MPPKTSCPVSKTQFLEKAEPLRVSINGQEMLAEVKEFSTGSFGWYMNGKTVVQIDGSDRYDTEETRQELLRQIAEVGGELVHELQGGDSVPVDREAEYGVALEWLSAIGDRLDPAGIYLGAVW